jgi:outer membrane murein-binding lipoprotein Lpp
VTRHRPVACPHALLAVLCAGGLLAGCGGEQSSRKTADSTAKARQLDTARARQLDTDRIARAIAQSIATERHLRANVVCPSAIVERKSYPFACLAVYHGGKTTFTVTQLDDQGHVSYAGN